MYINNIGIDRRILRNDEFGFHDKTRQQDPPIEMALVNRVSFKKSHTDIWDSYSHLRSSLELEVDPEESHCVKKEFERTIPRNGFKPQPLQHQLNRPKVGSGQVGRNAKHLQFLKRTPTMIEINKKLQKQEAALSSRNRQTSTPLNESLTHDKIELKKLEDVYRAYKGKTELVQLLFPSEDSSRIIAINSPRNKSAKPTYLNNPLSVVTFQDKGRAKSAVTQDSYLQRPRPPLSVLNQHMNHVPVPRYVPPSATTPRKSAQHNPAAYVPQTMAPYLYGIRGRPVQTNDRPYPVSRASQTSFGRVTPLFQTSISPKPIIIDSQPLPMVPPATPLNQSTSRLSSARSQRGEKPAAPLPEPVIGTPPIITDDRIEAANETRHPPTPRSGFLKSQAQVRFQLDDEISTRHNVSEVLSRKATTEGGDRPDDVVDETGSQKSDIDSVDMPINGTLTARLESGAPLPTEIYNVAALRDPTEL